LFRQPADELVSPPIPVIGKLRACHQANIGTTRERDFDYLAALSIAEIKL